MFNFKFFQTSLIPYTEAGYSVAQNETSFLTVLYNSNVLRHQLPSVEVCSLVSDVLIFCNHTDSTACGARLHSFYEECGVLLWIADWIPLVNGSAARAHRALVDLRTTSISTAVSMCECEEASASEADVSGV